MTLVIVGHEKIKDGWASAWGDDSASMKMRNDGLFAVSDSVITVNGTNGENPLLSGLRKIHGVEIKFWKPYFVDGYFRDYLDVASTSECFVAFAGSTLTATHALDIICEHLGKLLISYSRNSDRAEPATYVIQRHCEYNDIRDTQQVIRWDEDMFMRSDFAALFTADYVSKVIEHSINVALKSAKRYRLTRQALDLMKTDFVAGIHCPVTETHRLFEYRMKERENAEGVIEVFTERDEIPDGRVAVLGMRDAFERRAQAAYDSAVREGLSTGKELFRFLNAAIDEVAQQKSFAIDRPSVHKKLERGSVKIVSFEGRKDA
ncbi:hypothetical protein [Burkholderia gladioli]|uniref:hypothetical protein n=1 Tax=Burkholderia gladioli TaxID=28095 RepID=UPI001641FD15|nr:hypothetical protein [Burkholderia gladioli]